MKNSKTFYIIAPLSSLSQRARLFKLAKFIKSTSFTTIAHIGWERSKGEREETRLDFAIKKEIILSGGGLGSSKVKKMYFLWIIKVFFRALSISRNSTVWALGFESAFPVVLASKIKGYDVYFDDADRFSMLFNWGILNKLVERLERFTSRNSFKHIIPGQERYDFESQSFFILKNMPSQSEIERAKVLYKKMSWVQNKLVININGWLGEGRGMDIALQLSKKLENFPVSFVLAGRLACQDAISLSERNNVQYIGDVTNAEALASYFASDFVLTYYNPSSRINRLAESNKWGDAIKTGIGILVNSEVLTAEYLRIGGATVSVEYNDVDKLASILIDMLEDKGKIENIKRRSGFLATKFGYFEEQLTELLS